jgi:hypothetical protein
LILRVRSRAIPFLTLRSRSTRLSAAGRSAIRLPKNNLRRKYYSTAATATARLLDSTNCSKQSTPREHQPRKLRNICVEALKVGSGVYSYEYTNLPSSPSPTSRASSFRPSATPSSINRETSGSKVLVRMLSTLRAPLSTSVQRLAISSTTPSA